MKARETRRTFESISNLTRLANLGREYKASKISQMHLEDFNSVVHLTFPYIKRPYDDHQLGSQIHFDNLEMK